jgi:hypothetical protein
MEQPPQIPSLEEKFPDLPAGTKVVLEKKNLRGGTSSDVRLGAQLSGQILHDISVGQPIKLDDGSGTSNVRKLYRNEDRLFIDTQTSTYEVLHYREGHGLNIKNEYGEIRLPADAKEAKFDKEVVDVAIQGGEKIHINKPALQGVLIESHGGQIFRAMGGRIFVVAKVDNVHVPFYISSSGTSGKRKGEWYPFFGYTGDWLVKGKITGKNGEMEYHPAISKVQDLLNTELVLPVQYLSPRGKMGNRYEGDDVEPTDTVFDINKHFKYQNVYFTEFAGHEDPDKDFVERVTGYKPTKVKNDKGDSVDDWIKDVVSRIES